MKLRFAVSTLAFILVVACEPTSNTGPNVSPNANLAMQACSQNTRKTISAKDNDLGVTLRGICNGGQATIVWSLESGNPNFTLSLGPSVKLPKLPPFPKEYGFKKWLLFCTVTTTSTAHFDGGLWSIRMNVPGTADENITVLNGSKWQFEPADFRPFWATLKPGTTYVAALYEP
jgi:hypothetical protein